jgi:hypothetical protein
VYIFWQEQISYWTKIYCQPCWRILRYIIQWDRVWLDIFLFSVRHTYLAPVTVHYSLITSFSRPPHLLPRLACCKQFVNFSIIILFALSMILSKFAVEGIIRAHFWTWCQLIFCPSDDLSGGWILLQYIEGYKSIFSDSLPIVKKDKYPVH